MSKIVDYIKRNSYTPAQKTHLFSCIKYCSLTYLNKQNKAKIMQLMD